MNTDSGDYGANYLKRGAVAMFEIGMNLPEDAIYPDTGISPLDGRDKYVIHFAKDALPPVNEFWSVTVYDLQGFTVPNPTNRYTLGDRSNLKLNADGSLDIYLQSKNPGADKEANWLPTPAQPFSIHARLYSPRSAAIDGTWAMPPVEKVDRADIRIVLLHVRFCHKADIAMLVRNVRFRGNISRTFPYVCF